jgi:hypothetical protein
MLRSARIAAVDGVQNLGDIVHGSLNLADLAADCVARWHQRTQLIG